MKKYIFLLALPLLFSFSLDNSLLIGKWILVDVMHRSGPAYYPDAGLNRATWQFNADGTFESIHPNGNSRGTWKHENDRLLLNRNGRNEIMIIKTLNNESLVLFINEETQHRYKRVN